MLCMQKSRIFWTRTYEDSNIIHKVHTFFKLNFIAIFFRMQLVVRRKWIAVLRNLCNEHLLNSFLEVLGIALGDCNIDIPIDNVNETQALVWFFQHLLVVSCWSCQSSLFFIALDFPLLVIIQLIASSCHTFLLQGQIFSPSFIFTFFHSFIVLSSHSLWVSVRWNMIFENMDIVFFSNKHLYQIPVNLIGQIWPKILFPNKIQKIYFYLFLEFVAMTIRNLLY